MPSAPVAAGVAAIIGHVYPVWLRFRGGKGVATACGVFSILAPLATAIAAAMFVVTVWATRYVSLGSIVAARHAADAGLADTRVDARRDGRCRGGAPHHRAASRQSGRLRDGTERRLGQRIDSEAA